MFAKPNFQQPLLYSSVSHDLSESILICWFVAQKIILTPIFLTVVYVHIVLNISNCFSIYNDRYLMWRLCSVTRKKDDLHQVRTIHDQVHLYYFACCEYLKSSTVSCQLCPHSVLQKVLVFKNVLLWLSGHCTIRAGKITKILISRYEITIFYFTVTIYIYIYFTI